VTVSQDFVTNCSFSFKLHENGENRSYRSFEEKVQTYLDAITAPALAAYPDATPLRGIQLKAATQGSPLRFPDTMSSVDDGASRQNRAASPTSIAEWASIAPWLA
jgi:hypothetical protein